MPEWTGEQVSVIQRGVESTVVVAAPGSGKTTVLTEHIVHVIRDLRVAPSAIMAVTFTRQASEHMRQKLRGHRGLSWRAAETLRLGTFHALLFKVMLQLNANIPILLQPHEQKELMAEALKRAYHTKITTVHAVTEFLTIYSKTVGMCTQPELRTARKVIREYVRLKSKFNRWDYDDILLSAVEAIERHQADRFFSGIKYLLIDEFQDTNALQWRFVQLVHERFSIPVFVVGDDDQAIYKFRGASPAFLQKAQVELTHARQLMLTKNFRSDTSIVHHASNLLHFIVDRVDKPLCAVSKNGGYCSGFGFGRVADGHEALVTILRFLTQMSSALSIGILARTRAELYPVWALIKQQHITGTQVQLRTYHESKGKEWDVVCLLSTRHHSRYEEIEDGESERRLHYVAITRAKHVAVMISLTGSRQSLNPFFSEAGLSTCEWEDERLTDIAMALT